MLRYNQNDLFHLEQIIVITIFFTFECLTRNAIDFLYMIFNHMKLSVVNITTILFHLNYEKKIQLTTCTRSGAIIADEDGDGEPNSNF